MSMLPYDPTDWYWIVGGSTTQVWSSNRAQYVPASDATYLSWLDAGGLTTLIDTEASLQEVLASQFPAGWPPSQRQLSQEALGARLASGLHITCTGNAAVSGTYALDPTSTAQVFQIGTFAKAFGFFPSGGSTQMYPDSSGSQHTFTVAQFVAFLTALAALVSQLETQAGVVAAGGTPSWPSQSATIA